MSDFPSVTDQLALERFLSNRRLLIFTAAWCVAGAWPFRLFQTRASAAGVASARKCSPSSSWWRCRWQLRLCTSLIGENFFVAHFAAATSTSSKRLHCNTTQDIDVRRFSCVWRRSLACRRPFCSRAAWRSRKRRRRARPTWWRSATAPTAVRPARRPPKTSKKRRPTRPSWRSWCPSPTRSFLRRSPPQRSSPVGVQSARCRADTLAPRSAAPNRRKDCLQSASSGRVWFCAGKGACGQGRSGVSRNTYIWRWRHNNQGVGGHCGKD